MVRALVLAAASVTALLVAACVTPSQNRQDALVRITHQYNDGIRWGRYQDVVPHLAPAEAERFLARTGVLAEDFEMADDEVTAINFREQGLRADVTVDFTWYNQRRALLRRTLVAQEWRFVDGRWLCATQRRIRGDRFPLVPEPLVAPPPASAEGSAPAARATPTERP